MLTPSLLIVPARFKSGKLYSQLPTSGAGDFTVTRATEATRVNASGLIESVASGIPRLDYFASGGTVGCPALLVEPAATNGILNSADTITNWAVGANLTSGAIDVIGVSGNNLTVAVSGSGIGSAAGRIARSGNNVALASGSTYTISFFLKKTDTHTIGGYYALITGAASGNLGGGFNISGSFSSGSLYNTAGTTNRIRRVEQWGTDVFRCSETFTMTASGTLTSFFLAPVASVTSSNNSAVGTQLGFAAPQIELGSVPTSFIPTTTASVTRNADVVSVSGAVSGSIGQTEGTLYAEVDYRNFSTASQAILHLFQDGNNVIGIQMIRSGSNNLLQAYAFVLGSLVMSITYTIPSAGIYKIALGYKLDDYKLYVNGVDRGQDTSAGVPTMNQILLGHYTSSIQFNDRIRAAALYTTRLTNDQLAALTAP